MRMFSRNKSIYFVLFVGIFLANWLMAFGVGMSSSFDNYISTQANGSKTRYQYFLNHPVEQEDDKEKEKLTSCKFEMYDKTIDTNMSLTCLGIDEEDTIYFKNIKLSDKGMVISDLVSKKFGIKKGDSISLVNSYNGLTYEYQVKGIYHYEIGMTIFMKKLSLNNVLSQSEDYYNCIFSDQKLNLDSNDLVSTVTTENLKKSGEVMKDSMKSMMILFPVVAIIIYFVMMYLMIKIIIQKNQVGISMLKIFGFNYKEIKSMYIRFITIMSIGFIVASIPLSYLTMRFIWPSCIKTIAGYFEFTMSPLGFVVLLVSGLALYFISLVLNYGNIKKIPATMVLKNTEE